MGELSEIVFDAAHPAALARFWAEALDGYRVRDYDEAELARLAERGLTPQSDPVVLLDGPGPKLCCQLAAHQGAQANRLHLDLTSPDRPAQVARLTALGASEQAGYPDHTVLSDPEGNQFCLWDT